MLDEPAEAQRAHGRTLRRLLVGQAPHRVPQKEPVLGQRLQQVRALAVTVVSVMVMLLPLLQWSVGTLPARTDRSSSRHLHTSIAARNVSAAHC
jgi:hypothetical protein